MQRTPGKHGIADLWHDGNGKPTRLGHPDSTPKKPRGQGSRWRAWYIDSEGKERTKRFTSKAPAEVWLTKQTSDLHTGTHVDSRHGKLTLSTFYADWSKHQVWVLNTRRSMDLAVKVATFGDIPFAELRTSHIQAWVHSMTEDGLAALTVATRFQNVRSVLRAAVRDRKLSRDVSDGVKLPRRRKASAAMRIPSPDEVGRVLGAADGNFVAFIGVCAYGGLRLGEAAGLKVGDIDFLRKEIHINRQVQRINGGKVEVRAPKYGSERTVYAPEGLIQMLSEHVRLYAPGDDPERWVFPHPSMDVPLHQTTVWHRWSKTESDYRLHDLRHFYASGLIAAGCDVVTVQRALGHAQASVTLNTYSHLWPNADDRTRAAATALFDQTGGSAYIVRTEAQ